MTHQLEHIGTQGCDRFLDRRAPRTIFAAVSRPSRRQFVPHALIAPVFEALGQRHIDLVTTAGMAAHRSEREAALMAGIDQFRMAAGHVDAAADNCAAITAVNSVLVRVIRWNLTGAEPAIKRLRIFAWN